VSSVEHPGRRFLISGGALANTPNMEGGGGGGRTHPLKPGRSGKQVSDRQKRTNVAESLSIVVVSLAFLSFFNNHAESLFYRFNQNSDVKVPYLLVKICELAMQHILV
jgi:hypothetical protein